MEEIQIETHPEIIDLRTSIAAVRHQYNAAVIQRKFGLTVRLNQEMKEKEKVLRKKIASLRSELCWAHSWARSSHS